MIHRHQLHLTSMIFPHPFPHFCLASILPPGCDGPPDSVLACLMVVEAWHREGSGKGFDAVAQFGNASHSLWVLEKEILEVLQLS